MNMKVRKSVIAFLMATTMVGSTAVPAMADTATVTVSIKNTGLTGALQKTADYILPETSITVSKDGDAKVTAMDALLQAVGEGTQVDVTRNINGTDRTYHRKGSLEWYKSQYGNYISAIKKDGHTNTNKYFKDNANYKCDYQTRYYAFKNTIIIKFKTYIKLFLKYNIHNHYISKYKRNKCSNRSTYQRIPTNQ